MKSASKYQESKVQGKDSKGSKKDVELSSKPEKSSDKNKTPNKKK